MDSQRQDLKARRLLLADALFNVVLGGLLVTYPQRLVEALGLPEVRSFFYPTVLGGVLVGIGIALAVAFRGGAHGLGLDGAIAINFCGAGVVAVWLTAVPDRFTVTGRITLWIVVATVLGIGAVELTERFRTRQ
jgi:hypothetical protein